MADETKDLDIDLDEDLFDFGEASLADVFDGEDDADLDEIFAAFQEAQAAEPVEEAPEEDWDLEEIEPAGGTDDEEDDDEGFEEFFDNEPEPEPEPEPAPRPARAPARAASKVWTPESALADEPVRRSRRDSARNESRTIVATAGLSRSAMWALVAITSINALVAILTLHSMTTMRDNVVEVGRHVSATADEIRTGAYQQARVLNGLQTPVVPVDAEQHPTFDRARAEITQGDYGEARRRLYALLSIIDRLDPEQRSKVESRAQYLLAEALHLEALERMEAQQ